MKVLIKVPSSITKSKKLYLDLDPSIPISDLRKRISNFTGVPLCTFHLATSKLGLKVLLTDSWPLSFFIDEESPVLKMKLLESSRVIRRDSMSTFSSMIPSYSMISHQCSNRSDLIFLACKSGNLGALKDLSEALDRENSEEDYFNYSEPNFWTPLHYACLAGDAEIVRFLVTRKVNCNKVSTDEWTPLQIATYFSREEVVKILLEYPSLLINKKTKYRGTALHLACETNNLALVKLLLAKNACASLDDHRGKKPVELTRNDEVRGIIAEFNRKPQTKVNKKNDPSSFCSEVYSLSSLSLTDKAFFLYMDVETGTISRYLNKEQLLDKVKPEVFIRMVEIQDVQLETRRKNQHVFSITTSKSTMKYYTRFNELTQEWVERIKASLEFCMISKQNHILEQIQGNHEEANEDDSTESTNPTLNESENVDSSSFSIMEEIGYGSFGTVYKVSKNTNGQVFAMKLLNKSILQKQKQLKYAISECKIMKQLNHPFIVPLHFAFQTPKSLYLILELCPNGDLLALLEKKGLIEEQIARFYMAEVILALEYLHESDIIYRDLKPSNVLIDREFHAKLADFGLAKEKVNNINPAMTMAGSPAYLPPEIVSKKGATCASDIYGLGPMLYELLTAKTPYYSEDIDQLFQNIRTAKLSFPDHVSQPARDFINLVMQKDPAKRPQISQIKRHPFFRKMDWQALLARKIRPPKLGVENEEI